MKKIIKIGIVAVVFAFILFGIVAMISSTSGKDDGTNVDIKYRGHVDVYKIPANTKSPILVYSGKNLLVDNGRNYIRTQIGNGSAIASNSTKYISLSNSASAPAAGDTIIPAEITTNGLARATATYLTNGTGAWNYTYTWTATGAQSAQLTGLNYDSIAGSDGNLFASLQFTAVSLQANDQLRVVWSISVS